MRTGRARDHLHADGTDLVITQRFHQGSLMKRIQVADMHRTPLELAHLFSGRFVDTQDQIGARVQFPSIINNSGTGIMILSVRIPASITEAGLNDHLGASPNQLTRIDRSHGGSFIVRSDLVGDRGPCHSATLPLAATPDRFIGGVAWAAGSSWINCGGTRFRKDTVIGLQYLTIMVKL